MGSVLHAHEIKVMPTRKEVRTNIIILLFALTLMVIFASYLATHFTGESGIKSEQGLTFCQPEDAPPEQQRCYFTAHWHTFFDVKICGQPRVLPFETGDLLRLHTHVETNKVHWHGLLPVDPFTKQITDFSGLRLRNVFEELKIPVANGGIYGFKDGDRCPDGRPGRWRILVNDEEASEGMNYVLKDKDRIIMEFG